MRSAQTDTAMAWMPSFAARLSSARRQVRRCLSIHIHIHIHIHIYIHIYIHICIYMSMLLPSSEASRLISGSLVAH